MKPNADMITKVLHNFRVNGKFDQDQLIIGRGVDEQLQLMISDTIGIRYTPSVNGSEAKLEYTNDGATWYPLGGSGSAEITYEPIEFTGDNLQSDGTIHIQHNFNDKNVLCLGCTPQPKEITYLDNEIVLDYSDQNSSNLSGAVWFVNSKQEMLSGGTSDDPLTGDPVYVVSNAGTTSVNGEYRLIKPEYYNRYVDQAYIDAHTIVALYTNGTAVLEINGAEPYFYKTGFTASDTPFYAGVYSTAPNDPLAVTTWVILVGTAPAPTITAWSGGGGGN